MSAQQKAMEFVALLYENDANMATGGELTCIAHRSRGNITATNRSKYDIPSKIAKTNFLNFKKDVSV